MSLDVTLLTEQLQVVPVQCDLRIIDVLRCQLDLVMHLQRIVFGSCIDDSSGQAALTQPALALLEFGPALFPRF